MKNILRSTRAVAYFETGFSSWIVAVKYSHIWHIDGHATGQGTYGLVRPHSECFSLRDWENPWEWGWVRCWRGRKLWYVFSDFPKTCPKIVCLNCFNLPLQPCACVPITLSMSNTPKLSRFVWGTWRFDLIRTKSIRTTRSQAQWNNDTWTCLVLKTWQ